MTLVSMEKVVKRFRIQGGIMMPVLDIPFFELRQGERKALVGPSGSGKSTLLHLIAGISRPTEGSITFMGKRTDQLREAELDRLRAAHIGYVHQSFQLVPGFTALENVLAAASFGRVLDKRARRGRAAELLEQAGLGHRLHHRPAQLSQGEQQRVAIARALVNGPELLLADEPTASLDAATAAQIMELLLAAASDTGAALLLCTHDLEQAARMDGSVSMRELSLRPLSPAKGA
ncbi:ABC transporter ATP-binding protein [Paenibacillus sp. D51F]